MEIDCPHGWKRVMRLGNNSTFTDYRVNIYEGICDSPDCCGISTCEYYDTSEEATEIFLKAHAHEHTIEGYLENQNNPDRQLQHLQPRPKCEKKPHWDKGAEGLPDQFITAFDDLVARGFIEETGFNAEGEILYQLTSKKLKTEQTKIL